MTSVQVRPRTTCRGCDGPLTQVLDLGDQYVSDFLPTAEGHEAAWSSPLILAMCGGCKLVQLTHTVPRDLLYRQYWYRSGVNESMREALHDVVYQARWMSGLEEGDTVIDIGANDGTLLSYYAGADGVSQFTRVAFDPALNLHGELSRRCEILVPDYFPARRYEGPKAKIITAVAMLYDLEDPREFVLEVARLLRDDGIFVAQFGDLLSMLGSNGFDTICHEHLEYYTFHDVQHLLWLHRLRIFRVEQNAVNGGSLRIYACHDGAAYKNEPSVIQTLEREKKAGLQTLVPLETFAVRIATIRDKMRRILVEMRDAGRVVDLLGASTKGNTLLQYFGINWQLVRRAVERSPEKVGKFTVGTRIPIVGEQEGRLDPPDAYLCPIWQFKRSVIERETDFIFGSNGKIIFPLPHPVVVSEDVADGMISEEIL